MKRIGVDKARTKLGQLAKEVAADREEVVLTHRGQPIALLVSLDEYENLIVLRAEKARDELKARLADVRRSVADAGLDVSVVDEAISAARRATRG